MTTSIIRGDDNMDSADVPTQRFASAELIITSAGQRTEAHSMDGTPSMIVSALVCQIAEHGYSVGETLSVPIGHTSTVASDDHGMAVRADATNIVIRFGSNANVFPATHGTTGVGVLLTNANWKLKVTAWK
jgi:hypothetical protein